ncbi:Hypothetical protein NTJ_02294 [Nesidiocoris tenuis]|nr:Hypothetical protein NTJ_02294 [Nesidiocoris tenuis]
MCLIPHKDGSKCAQYHCLICGKPHNKLLHGDEHPAGVSEPIVGAISASSTEISLSSSQVRRPRVLLSTAIVHINRADGTVLPCRLLLDSGSMSNFISSRLAKELNLDHERTNVSISGIGGNIAGAPSFRTNCLIKSRYEPFEINLEFLVIPRITLPIPESPIDISKWNIPSGIFLADPDFITPKNIDMLIGAELFFNILKGEQISLGPDMPKMNHTMFGWVVGGKIGKTPPKEDEITCVNTCIALDEALKKFWDIEEGFLHPRLNKEERSCEKLFVETTTRDSSGRFIVKLPTNEKLPSLGNSKTTAYKRFLNLEKRLNRDPKLHASYVAFMSEYKKLGHMELASDCPTNLPSYYLPHHCVTNANSSTTKLRVVFDGSAKTSTGISLNDVLMTGPTIQDDLLSIILRFRKYNFVITADITKMYRQVIVQPNDRHLQKVFWRESSAEPIQEFQLKTITYGTTPASFLATRCLQEASDSMKDTYPDAAKAIRRDFYMDDYIGGHDDLNELKRIKEGVIYILKGAGMDLHKWCSNNPKLLEDIPRDKQEAKYIPDSKDICIKALGLWWNPSEDDFKYSVSVCKDRDQVTKRQVSSMTAQIFDPLGLIGPVIIKAKMFLQALWNEKLDWDDPLPEALLQEWNVFLQDLPNLQHLRIPRQVFKNGGLRVELHGFADSSERAYGAVLYVRTVHDGVFSRNKILISKSRVAPTKKITLPRLELCGALLLATLYQKVKQSIQVDFSQVFLWTDSTIVLSWLKAPSSRWKTFVANRVSEIQDLTTGCTWLHVNSKDNPADKISRGLSASDLISDDLWWSGPEWLRKNDVHWPKQPTDFDVNEDERVTTLTTTKPAEIITWERYSSFSRLLRIIIYIKRFIKIRLEKKLRIPLDFSPQEFREAEVTLLRMVQSQSFSDEMKQLSKSEPLQRKNKISNLCPFLDDEGLIRVGGRIQNAPVPYDQKHQVLLPKNHHVTKLIIRAEHLRALHAGPQSTLSAVRQRYWPVDGKTSVKKITRTCITCYRNKPKPGQQLMGNLPIDRLTSTRAFLRTGVDYCGPIRIKSGTTRNAKPCKAYVAIFVCLTVKAIHIELITDLTSESFLAALKRFSSRRGKPALLASDNGTNFTGAKRILHDQFLKLKEDPVLSQHLASEQMDWKFIPPYSPEFGGLWESAVKSFKHHFKRICGDTLYTYEETYTYLTMIEACLNSRPITPMSDDPNEVSALTPGHFLIGDELTALPQPDVQDSKTLSLPRWHRVQQMFQTFWSRFTREYLTTLQPRPKNLKAAPNLRPGQLVLIKNEDLPPMKWPLGRILLVHPGDDGLTRVATIKTQSGTFKRSINKLCPLPIEDESSQL